MSFVVTRDRLNELLLVYLNQISTEEMKFTIDDIDFFIDDLTYLQAMQEAHFYNSVDRDEYESFLIGYLGEHVRIGKRILEMNDTKVLKAFLGVSNKDSYANLLAKTNDLLSKEDAVNEIKSGVLHICSVAATELNYSELCDRDKDIVKKVIEKRLQDIVYEVIGESL